MRWLENQEVLVLVLKDELIDERVFLKHLKLFLELLHVEMATSVAENLQEVVCVWLVVTENEVTQGEVGVRKLVCWQ